MYHIENQRDSAMKYQITIEFDEIGNVLLVLPEDMVEQLGWQADDLLTVEVEQDRMIISRIEAD
jgi:antitoxin component of MazEF toxin-antitoxin module